MVVCLLFGNTCHCQRAISSQQVNNLHCRLLKDVETLQTGYHPYQLVQAGLLINSIIDRISINSMTSHTECNQVQQDARWRSKSDMVIEPYGLSSNKNVNYPVYCPVGCMLSIISNKLFVWLLSTDFNDFRTGCAQPEPGLAMTSGSHTEGSFSGSGSDIYVIAAVGEP